MQSHSAERPGLGGTVLAYGLEWDAGKGNSKRGGIG